MQAILNMGVSIKDAMRSSIRQLWWAYAMLLTVILLGMLSLVPAHIWSTVITYMVQNPIEVFATATSVAGAAMLATKSKYAAWAWLLWIASNLAWIYLAYQLPKPSMGLIVQNLVFAGINVHGTWHWLVKPYLQKNESGEL